MSGAPFTVDGNRAVGSAHTAGPWNPGLMHGGAPAALIARAAERTPTPEPMRIARVTVDLLRPVPVGELAVATEVVRQGRKIQLLQVRLLSNGVEVTRGSVLKVRTADVGVGETYLAPLDEPAPEACPAADTGHAAQSFNTNFEMRTVRGGFGEPGPGCVWFRLVRPLVAGETTSPAVLAAAVSDFSNGISSVLPFERFTFLNGDLAVSFARPPRGDWILSNAQSWIGPDGGGQAFSRLADRNGYFGVATQSLVVDPR